MLTKRIIACLDVRSGRVVKGVQFVDLVDAGDPAELARRHAAAGADEIVLLDITATHEGRGTLLDTVRRTAKELFIPFTVGGGIRSADEAAAVFDAGGVLRQLGVRLVPSNDAEESVEAFGGTRHTSGRRYSYDDPVATVIAVSEDGPVSVLRNGEVLGRSRITTDL